jgi:hypothetical protein
MGITAVFDLTGTTIYQITRDSIPVRQWRHAGEFRDALVTIEAARTEAIDRSGTGFGGPVGLGPRPPASTALPA